MQTAKQTLAGRETPAIDPSFAPLVAAFAADGRVSMGKMLRSSGLKVNGRVFAPVVKGRLVVKLPRERVFELVNSGAGEQFDRGNGRPLREWTAIAPGAADWVELAREAQRFVGRAQ